MSESKIKKSENRKNPLKRTKKTTLPEKRTYLKQSNTLTFANYDFSQIQIKGLVIVIEHLQGAMEESLQTKKPAIQLSIFDNMFEKEFEEVAEIGKPAVLKENVIQFKISLKEFGVSPNNYDVLKTALKTIQQTPVELAITDPKTHKNYTRITSLFDVIIENPQPYFDEKKGKVVTPRINHVFIHMKQSVALSLLNLEKGFTKYMKEIVMNQSSKYTIRIYMLLSALKSKGGLIIRYKKLCQILGISDEQYRNYYDFHKRVIRPAYEALHEKADIWFEMSETYDHGGKNVEKLNFKIIQDRGILSQEEFISKRTLLMDLIQTHFGLSDFDLKVIRDKFNPDNVNGFLAVIMRIKDYAGKENVINVAEYAYQSIINELEKGKEIELE